jgi:hypothetical protein
MAKVAEQGPQWHRLAPFFPFRTDINIKNRYHVLSRKTGKPAIAVLTETVPEQTNQQIRKTVVGEPGQTGLVNVPPPTEASPFSVASLLNA